MSDQKKTASKATATQEKSIPENGSQMKPSSKEIGGRSGPEPTRYGDWEKNGIISDF